MNGSQESLMLGDAQNANRFIGTELEKKCYKCQNVLSIKKFAKSKYGRYGVGSCCKGCYKQYHELHKEHISKTKKQWAINNKEKINENKRKYYRNNSKKIIEQNSKWKKIHPEESAKISAKWRKLNPEKCKEVRKKSYNKNCEERNRVAKIYKEIHREDLLKKQREHYAQNRDRSIAVALNWKNNNKERAAEIQGRRKARKLATFVEKINPIEIFENNRWICQICFMPVDKNLKRPNLDSSYWIGGIL